MFKIASIIFYNAWMLGTLFMWGKAVIQLVQNDNKKWFIVSLITAPFWPLMLVYKSTRRVLGKQLEEN